MDIDRALLLELFDDDIDFVIAQHGPAINAWACAAISACNRGTFPTTYRQWRSVFNCLGLRVVLVYPECLDEPCVRYDNEERTRGRLYLPLVTNRRRIFFWLLHEASETAMKRPDLVPELHYPHRWGDHHDMACVVEACHEGQIMLEGSIDDLVYVQ